jgi:hypothetical protein
MSSASGEHVPQRDELFALYQIAIEEYRFQVNLNWSRTQYYLVLNVAIFAAATGILQLAKSTVGALVAGVYLAGAICCGLALVATRVQQGYYQAARDHKADIESKLELGPLSLATTPGMGSPFRRLGKVTTFISVMLSLLAAIDLAGSIASLTKAF